LVGYGEIVPTFNILCHAKQIVDQVNVFNANQREIRSAMNSMRKNTSKTAFNTSPS